MRFTDKLKRREPVLGIFMKTTDPAFVEIAGLAGLDFVILDREHGPAGLDTLQNLIRAAELSGVFPIVRTPDSKPNSLSSVLDIGARGVQIPHVSSEFEADRAVKVSKFHPRGERGLCRYVRAAGYSSVPKQEYFARSEDNVVILQIEGLGGRESFDRILALPGYDILFIGPYDLSQAMGHPGEVKHPEVVGAMAEMAGKAARAGKILGTFVESLEDVRFWRKAGLLYFAYSVDVGLFYQTLKKLAEDFTEAKR
jgi:4-hydroxy-2-oxoheptanedioate aldolase